MTRLTEEVARYHEKEAEEAKKVKELEDVWYVCRDVVDGHLCGDRFESKEVRGAPLIVE